MKLDSPFLYHLVREVTPTRGTSIRNALNNALYFGAFRIVKDLVSRLNFDDKESRDSLIKALKDLPRDLTRQEIIDLLGSSIRRLPIIDLGTLMDDYISGIRIKEILIFHDLGIVLRELDLFKLLRRLRDKIIDSEEKRQLLKEYLQRVLDNPDLNSEVGYEIREYLVGYLSK